MQDFEPSAILVAFGLTVLAGLSTGIGSLLALLAKRTGTRFLSLSLGFSAGFMIYVSLVELLAESRHSLGLVLGERSGSWGAMAAFFGGLAIAAVIDRLVPSVENPHEVRFVESMHGEPLYQRHGSEKLMRVGVMSAVAIAVHNFPEGLATFAASLQSPTIGIAIAVAIALHNIPEGIAVAIPIFNATGSRRKALWYSVLSGLSEPLGALIGFLFLSRFMGPLTFGSLYGLIAGIMTFISLDELLPTAREYGSPHLSIYGLIAGMMVMAVSLQLFA